VAVHAVVLSVAGIYGIFVPEPEPIGAAPVAIEIVPPQPEVPEPVLDVALIPDEVAASVPAISQDVPAPAQRRSQQRVAIANSVGPAVVAEPNATTGQPTAHNRYFDMRRPGAGLDLALPKGFRDPLTHVPAGTKPEADIDSGRLAPAGGGSYKSNEGVFTAKVAPDGSVHLKDGNNFHVDLPSGKKIARTVGDWTSSDDKIPNDPDKEPINNHRPADTDTRPDHGQVASVPIAGGGFDITDAIMRRKKVDPYASRKLAYLDATRDQRVQIGKRHRDAQLDKSAMLMQKNLDAMWAQTPNLTARKQALFELWDECAETGDARVVEGGRTARTLVIGFIRARLPAGTTSAFTTSELATLNRKRQSKAVFAPYE
jgi:hypothetical protein